MKTFLKVLVSLSVFVGVFVFLFFFSSKFFSIIDSHYYQASIVDSIREELDASLQDFSLWNASLNEKFVSFASDEVVKRCMGSSQTDGDIALREKMATELILSIPSMQGIRVIEKDTQRIHFSTFSSDIISKTPTLVSYAKYGKNPKDIPYETLREASLKKHPCVDMRENLFIFASEFYDDYGVHRGYVFFYISAKSFARQLINEKRLSISEEVQLLTDDTQSFIGLVTGLPYDGSNAMKEEVLKEWKGNSTFLSQIATDEASSIPFWVLVTHKKTNIQSSSENSSVDSSVTIPIYMGRICDKSMFVMPSYARYFLIFTISLSFFLISFLILNLKQDKILVARKKIRKLHKGIMQDILKEAHSLDDASLKEKIEYRRHDANVQVRKALGKKLAKKYENEITDILEQSWLSIISVLKNKTETVEHKTISKEDEILKLLNEILDQGRASNFMPSSASVASRVQQANNSVKPVLSPKVAMPFATASPSMQDETLQPSESIGELDGNEFDGLEEVEELEELEELEQLDEVEEEVGEVVEERDTKDLDKESLENVEGSVENIEELDEVEELEELEEEVEKGAVTIEESNQIETLEDGELEQVEMVETLEEVESFEEVLVDDFVTFEEEVTPVTRPSNLEVDDYIEPDNKLDDSQIAEAEDRFKDINIGGLDFSYLDESKDDDVSCVSLLSTENPWIEKPIISYIASHVAEMLEVVGEEEPSQLLNLEGDDIIVNKDGIYTVNDSKSLVPGDVQFKSLVDSVIRGDTLLF